MKLLKNLKKGFTLIELVVVIAVIAILSAVSVISYVGITNKAKKAADSEIITQLNTQMVSQSILEGHNKTAYDAYLDAKEAGFDLELLKPQTGGKYVWDEDNDLFACVKLSDDKKSFGEVIAEDKTAPFSKVKSSKAWVFTDSVDEDTKFSQFMNKASTQESVVVSAGFDGGENKNIKSVSFKGTGVDGQEVVIHTNGGKLTVNDPSADGKVLHYGYAEVVDVQKVAMASYHEHGIVPFVKVAAGHIEVANDGWINAIHFMNKDTKTFDEIKVTVETSEMPKFSREPITIDNGAEVKVATIVIEKDTEVIYLTKDGIFEQVKIAEVVDGVVGEKAFIEGNPDDSKLNKVADQVANNIIGTKGTDYTIAEDTRDLTVTSGNKEDIIVNGTSAIEAEIASEFKGGSGLTANDPFEIYDYYTFQKVTEIYDIGYRYFKVKDGVTTIDCSGWSPVNLNGSFDGNGVTLLNVTANLFQRVGYKLNNDSISIKDMTVNMNVTATQQYGVGTMIKQIDNRGITTFQNVNIHGYMEGYWNVGSFFSYGTANYDDKGCDYTAEFINCTSDATLVCATGNTCGGFVGHAFQGAGNTATLKFTNSEFTGKILTTGGTGNKYFAMTSDGTHAKDKLYINGELIATDKVNSTNGGYKNCSKIEKIAATKQSDGYYVTKASGASKIVVSITGQITAYDGNNVALPNVSGITIALTFDQISDLSNSTKVMNLFNSVNLINKDGKTVIENNTLKVFTNSVSNYKTGTIRLQVNQYSSNGQLLACGTLDVASLTTPDGAWEIK